MGPRSRLVTAGRAPRCVGFLLVADAAFLAAHQLGDIAAVTPYQQRTHHDNRQRDDMRPEQKTVEERREYGRGQSRQRRIAREECHDQPRQQRSNAEDRIDREQHTRGGRHTLAALEAEENRIQMTEKHGDARYRHRRIVEPVARAEVHHEPHRQPAFEGVADQRENRGLLAAAA
ncbi:hypothetical protein KCU90_g1477, partial [Aureobasidium melanogenum]